MNKYLYIIKNFKIKPWIKYWLLSKNGIIEKILGIPPLILNNSVGKNLKDYLIFGNSIQNGTPTPTNPIEIESVGDKTKNFISSIFNGYFTNNVEDLTENNAYRTFIADSLPAGTYTFSTNINDCVILRLYKDGEINSAFATASTYTFTTVTTGKVLICCRNNTTTELENGIVGQFETGEMATNYEPNGYKIPIITRSKNILPPTINTNSSYIENNGVRLSLSNDKYHLEGLCTSSGGRTVLKTKNFYLKSRYL